MTIKKEKGETVDQHTRCTWARTPLSIAYHDLEWGVPVHDDKALFEFLILEGAQAGLSWETILKKREAYRQAFAGFDPARGGQVQAGTSRAFAEESRHCSQPSQGRQHGGTPRPSLPFSASSGVSMPMCGALLAGRLA